MMKKVIISLVKERKYIGVKFEEWGYNWVVDLIKFTFYKVLNKLIYNKGDVKNGRMFKWL